MKKQLVVCALAGLMAASPAVAAPWVRGYAVGNYEPAFYYGGKAGGTEAAGSDCPKGTNPDNDYAKILDTGWRPKSEIDAYLKPAQGRASDAAGGPRGTNSGGISYRGFKPGVETYINPFAAPDPGMQQVTGKIAEGFDLDGNAKTGGFTSPEGLRGVDNGFYRAWGCLMSFRGSPYHAYLSQRSNDKMVDGMYTMVIRVSGAKDPMNDDNATLEIGYSPDHLVKDPNGNITRDYSYRLVTSEQYTKMKAVIKNGIVETVEPIALHMPAFSWGETNRGDAVFQKGKVRLILNKDGTADGLAGGYRDWRDIYMRDTFNSPSDGTTRETYYHENQIAMYYALKRNADGMPDKNGQNSAISQVFRFTAVPGYVVNPTTAAKVDEPPYPRGARTATRRGLFMQAQNTHAISYEAANARQRGGDDDAPDASPAPAPKPAPVTPKPTASNAKPTTVASAQ